MIWANGAQPWLPLVARKRPDIAGENERHIAVPKRYASLKDLDMSKCRGDLIPSLCCYTSTNHSDP
jgi:hypothetical protein